MPACRPRDLAKPAHPPCSCAAATTLRSARTRSSGTSIPWRSSGWSCSSISSSGFQLAAGMGCTLPDIRRSRLRLRAKLGANLLRRSAQLIDSCGVTRPGNEDGFPGIVVIPPFKGPDIGFSRWHREPKLLIALRDMGQERVQCLLPDCLESMVFESMDFLTENWPNVVQKSWLKRTATFR